MNKLKKLLELTKNNDIEVSVPLTSMIEECLVEVKYNDDFTINGVFKVTNHIISCYAIATSTTYLNTVVNDQILAFKSVLDATYLISLVESTEREFELFCKKVYDHIRLYK